MLFKQSWIILFTFFKKVIFFQQQKQQQQKKDVKFQWIKFRINMDKIHVEVENSKQVSPMWPTVRYPRGWEKVLMRENRLLNKPKWEKNIVGHWTGKFWIWERVEALKEEQDGKRAVHVIQVGIPCSYSWEALGFFFQLALQSVDFWCQNECDLQVLSVTQIM